MLNLLTDKYEDLLKKVETMAYYKQNFIIWISGIILCIPIFEIINLKLSFPILILYYIIMGIFIGFVFNFTISLINYIIFNIAKANTSLKKVRTNILISYIPFFLIIVYGRLAQLTENTFYLSGNIQKLFNLTNNIIIAFLFIYCYFLVFKGAVSYNKANPLWLGIIFIILTLPFSFFFIGPLWLWFNIVS